MNKKAMRIKGYLSSSSSDQLNEDINESSSSPDCLQEDELGKDFFMQELKPFPADGDYKQMIQNNLEGLKTRLKETGHYVVADGRVA